MLVCNSLNSYKQILILFNESNCPIFIGDYCILSVDMKEKKNTIELFNIKSIRVGFSV